uniref:Uncharacterized protein n=1 Tax=viral metagenome TaxID=1070528 RepID=A0A6C0D5W3_9ZZZZ
MTDAEEKKKIKEWLQLIEFIRRIYGEDKAEFIRTNDYEKRNNKSVAEYYNISGQNLTLSNLLQKQAFLNKVISASETKDTLAHYTQIYNETNTLMKSLDNSQDNIYIKCNPLDDNGNVIEASNNTIGSNISSLNSIFDEVGNSFGPNFLYNNIGLQTFISVLFFIIIYYIGKTIFINYPRSMIAKRV